MLWYMRPLLEELVSLDTFHNKLNYLEYPIPIARVLAFAGQQVPPYALTAHTAWVKGQKEVELKTLFSQQAEHELLQTVREFHMCKKEEGQSVSSYILKMKRYIDNLELLGHPVSLNLEVSLILVFLRKEYDSFMQNYNMHGMGKTVNELHVMLKLHEKTLPKKDALALHGIRAGNSRVLDHIKEHRIIAHCTPLYTPQHNDVFERRNRTLLDMVRSMVSQTTLLKSFWDYDLGSAARILNIVPTKKVEKTSYELGDLNEPGNYKAALLDLEFDKWLDAMNVEMQSMKDNEVRDLVDLPPNARLVAKGFTQTYRIDYEETFSLVADIRAIRILIAITAFYDYEILQMDVKTAFLNGHLLEEVYMVQPEGFVNPKYPN
ncbi:zinc finger, CCHC-type containing protein [Tanacetum coccineum]